MSEWEALLPYCLGDQERKIRAIAECGGNARRAGEKLGISERNMRATLKAVRARAALAGHMPEVGITSALPAPFIADRVTVGIKDAEGNRHWLKGKVEDAQKLDMFKAAAESMAEELPRYRPIKAPKTKRADLLNTYVLTDCHVGMLAWHKEGGQDWNLDEAERVLTGCFELMLDRSPEADTAVICQLGDWMHFDSHLPVTPTHGHILDSAGRPAQIIDAAIRILRRIVDAALTKHRRVVLLIAEGNHDIQSSIWLRRLFSAAYEREKRLEIIHSETPYYVYEHGQTSLFFHHQHMRKGTDLCRAIPALYPKEWGRTTWRYVHGGNFHSLRQEEHPGLYYEQHPTLTGRDSHTSRHAWLSGRRAACITYHIENGEAGRVIVTPEMLQRAA